MRVALSERDMGTVIRIFRQWTGASQTDICILVGIAQPHVSELERGIRRITTLELFERFADGLNIPRPLLGLAERGEDQQALAPEANRHEAEKSSPLLLKSIDFIDWIADHSKLSIREAHSRLTARITGSQATPQ